MPVLGTLVTFSAGLIIRSEHNANWAALRTWADNSVVHTDVAKTITVTHTFSAAQTFSSTINGQTISSAASLTGTLAVAGVATLASRLVFSTAASQITPGATSLSLRNNANNADNVLVSDAGVVTVRAGLTITAGGLTVTAGGASITGNSTVTGNLTVTGTLSALGNITPYRTTSDATTTSVTPADTSLSIAVGANQEWRIDVQLSINCDNTGGVVLQFTAPAGATAQTTWIGNTSSHSAIYGRAANTFASVQTWSTFNSSVSTNGVMVQVSLYVKTVGTAGNVVLQLSSNTAGQTSKVLTGSTALATRLA